MENPQIQPATMTAAPTLACRHLRLIDRIQEDGKDTPQFRCLECGALVGEREQPNKDE